MNVVAVNSRSYTVLSAIGKGGSSKVPDPAISPLLKMYWELFSLVTL